MAYTAELALFLLLIIPLAAAALIPLVGTILCFCRDCYLWGDGHCGFRQPHHAFHILRSPDDIDIPIGDA